MAGQRTCQRRSSRAGPGKMQEPPKSIEEFLKFQNWDYWPREIHFRDDDKWSCTLKKIKEDSSFVSIYTHLWENVPRIFEALLIMESKLKEYSLILQNHTSEIFKWKSMISETSSYRKLERYGEFLKKYHKKKKIMERVFKIWKTHFLSEASIALLHDSFWWWFLHKFRIYPDCLAQAIYATFHEAFPESSYLFNDEFKEDLGNNIFLWCSGLKPQKGFWIHWKLKELSTTTIHGSKKAPAKSVKERIADSQEHISTSIDFNIIKILNNPRAYTLPISKEESRLSRLATKSHYSSTGPEFNRVLFNFGGQSPLILYYLKMHELAGISKAPKKTKIKLTKIFQEPLPAPTYRDVIKEAKRQFARNQKDFRMEKLRINEEIKLLKQQQERIDKELDRLQAKATKKPHEVKQDFEKFLHKLRSEAEIERECVASLSSSSSSSPSSTDNYNFEEEEY
ncbi:protein FAM227B isoform X6 [Homo sapiens]|uniref:protein FAM227B isoform X6 n=1 Tax=Homo sapiens TaxID=9606 RepID=UPI0007DC70D1|nr:protein FAM227B isoform X6 [Homo sapiens]XP_054233426.1 protein FAM227B isoform X6 [Homo sapiens]|eukprot:XP_016877479.1 protein FAM227B isoform X6 [Homo sapiens]